MRSPAVIVFAVALFGLIAGATRMNSLVFGVAVMVAAFGVERLLEERDR